MLSRKHEQPLRLVTGAAENFNNPRRSCRTDPPPSLRISDFQPLSAPISHTTTHSAKSKDFLSSSPPSLTLLSSLLLHLFIFQSFSTSGVPSIAAPLHTIIRVVSLTRDQLSQPSRSSRHAIPCSNNGKVCAAKIHDDC
jgi:hypothetical protein